MTRCVLGIDTSCYTTSTAAVSLAGGQLAQQRRLLCVPVGERGLQQSQGVFQHVQQLPALTEALMGALRADVPDAVIAAVCASTRPRAVEGSYMPVFTVGESFARGLAAALDVPFFATCHQQGHLWAARVRSGLPEGPHLAIHLSGGTSELLLSDGDALTLLGGTGDLHAGQFVDRVGTAMGLPFPAGPELTALALSGHARSRIPASADGLSVSFSGAESCAQRLIAAGELSREDIAAEVFSCLARTLAKWIARARTQTGVGRVLLMGGVACSHLLRALLPERLARERAEVSLYWAQPELSGDNAVGVALLGAQMLRAGARQT